MHSIDNKRIANEKDFDGNTGKLYTSKDKDKILLLEHDMANKVMNWLIGRDAIKDKKKAGTASIFRIKSIDSKKLTRNPPKAFITSTLQQDASRKLGLSPSRTMSIAQKLYEEGIFPIRYFLILFLSLTRLLMLQRFHNVHEDRLATTFVSSAQHCTELCKEDIWG